MATFCVEIPDEDIGRILTAVCANYNYATQVEDPNSDLPGATIDNPENPYQFVNRMTRQYLIENTTAYEIAVAKAEAMQTTAGPPNITDPTL